MSIQFRPHHFLCALCFQGKGYSLAFVANFQTIMDRLHSPDGNQVLIEVTPHTDSICNPCPHRQQNHCSTEEKIAVLDKAHAKALGIQPGDLLTWQEAKQRIATMIDLSRFHTICASCSWKSAGICEQALNQFLTVDAHGTTD